MSEQAENGEDYGDYDDDYEDEDYDPNYMEGADDGDEDMDFKPRKFDEYSRKVLKLMYIPNDETQIVGEMLGH